MHSLIGREFDLFDIDLVHADTYLSEKIASSSFLIIGGAGSVGQAVTKEIFSRNPKKLHVVDLSENSLVELVRDIRSSFGYISGDFRTFALDCGSLSFFLMSEAEGPYDYVLNLSALKHVRSERDPWTLMRMIEVNILNVIKSVDHAISNNASKYFCVSTDKAANPANMMGASKRVMEMFLAQKGEEIPISTARFANVAFSDGGLLHGFKQRIEKGQPIAAPSDVKRYFMTPEEAGKLCLFSTIYGRNLEIFFPKLTKELNLVTFKSIAEAYLSSIGFGVIECESEEEARDIAHRGGIDKKWPCYFSESDTTGEKDAEEFFTDDEEVNFDRFNAIGIVMNSNAIQYEKLNFFLKEIERMIEVRYWTREEIIHLFTETVPGFEHLEKFRFLDQKM